MLRPLFLHVLLLGLLAACADAEVPIGGAAAGGLRFRMVRTANGAGPAWLEAEVDVLARPAPDSPGGLVPRVKVTLTLATGGEGGARHFEFFQASAVAVALPGGRTPVRFYLPPEIVARDAVRGEIRFWRVDVTTGAKSGGELRTVYGPGLTSADSRRNFSTQAEANTAANDGLLVPQYLSPFATEYPAATPSFIRSERAG